jgi:hypothetical protein
MYTSFTLLLAEPLNLLPHHKKIEIIIIVSITYKIILTNNWKLSRITFYIIIQDQDKSAHNSQYFLH